VDVCAVKEVVRHKSKHFDFQTCVCLVLV